MSTVTETTIQMLRERLLNGAYPPGARLQEFALAKDLNVSRTPIRDALRVLASEDLLVYSPNRGYAVRDVVLKDVLDAYDIRATLEGMACRIIAERGLSTGAAAHFDELLARGTAIVEVDEFGSEQQAAWSEVNTQFHHAIAMEAGSKPLEEILRQVRRIPRMFDGRLRPNTDFFRSVYTHEQRRRSHREHIRIVEILKQRDPGRAEALMREHVYINRDLLRESYERLIGTDAPPAAIVKRRRRTAAAPA